MSPEVGQNVALEIFILEIESPPFPRGASVHEIVAQGVGIVERSALAEFIKGRIGSGNPSSEVGIVIESCQTRTEGTTLGADKISGKENRYKNNKRADDTRASLRLSR